MDTLRTFSGLEMIYKDTVGTMYTLVCGHWIFSGLEMMNKDTVGTMHTIAMCHQCDWCTGPLLFFLWEIIGITDSYTVVKN